MADEKEKEVAEKETQTIEGETTSIPVEPGDKIKITLSKEESAIIDEVKLIKSGNFKKNETKDIVDIIDNTLSLQVPAVDGAVATIEIPEDADVNVLDDVTMGVSEDVLADIVTLVGNAGE